MPISVVTGLSAARRLFSSVIALHFGASIVYHTIERLVLVQAEPWYLLPPSDGSGIRTKAFGLSLLLISVATCLSAARRQRRQNRPFAIHRRPRLRRVDGIGVRAGVPTVSNRTTIPRSLWASGGEWRPRARSTHGHRHPGAHCVIALRLQLNQHLLQDGDVDVGTEESRRYRAVKSESLPLRLDRPLSGVPSSAA